MMKDNDDALPTLALTDARVEFANVGFAYRADTPVLRGMTFDAQRGKLTALVGPSGGGESTVLNLIPQFYDPKSGHILIDGQNIVAVSRRSLRHEIAYVGQIVHLFRGTIRENIALGKLGASDAEICAAARAAHAHDFIMDFPAGYGTPVGEHGLQLSGGQRRARRGRAADRGIPPIVLLKKASASLRIGTGGTCRKPLPSSARVAPPSPVHGLSTIWRAGCILVVENGLIVKSGRHDELLRKGGRYASFSGCN